MQSNFADCVCNVCKTVYIKGTGNLTDNLSMFRVNTKCRNRRKMIMIAAHIIVSCKFQSVMWGKHGDFFCAELLPLMKRALLDLLWSRVENAVKSLKDSLHFGNDHFTTSTIQP